MVNPLQRARQVNLDLVKRLIGDGKPAGIDRAKLKRVVVLRLGCTEFKAEEYIRLVLGE